MSEQSVLDQIPLEKQTLVCQFVARLETIAGVQAIALGGSFARGLAKPYSDIDLVLYYRERAPFQPAELGDAVATLTLNKPQLTEFYGWGPWVNGGGWLDTAQGRVDLLYRNLDQIERVISAAQERQDCTRLLPTAYLWLSQHHLFGGNFWRPPVDGLAPGITKVTRKRFDVSALAQANPNPKRVALR